MTLLVCHSTITQHRPLSTVAHLHAHELTAKTSIAPIKQAISDQKQNPSKMKNEVSPKLNEGSAFRSIAILKAIRLIRKALHKIEQILCAGAQGNPVGAAVFLHGLTNSPYSLRRVARRYREHGYVSIPIRLPAHGTVPGALTDVAWQDWMAATRLAVRGATAHRPIAPPCTSSAFPMAAPSR